MQERTDKMLDFLNKRELERRQDHQTKKDDRDSSNAENEKIEYFERSFNERKLEILDAIERARQLTDRKECAEHFDRVFKDILALQKYVAASNIFLRTYDIKVYQKSIQDLTSEAKDMELVLLPKKKFGFKGKKNEPKQNGNAYCAPKINGEITLTAVLDDNFCGFKNETGQTLTLRGSEILKKDVSLHHLTGCTVRIFGTPSTLHLNDLKQCRVFSGPVSTSIFADNCTDCTLVISCQQLRLHSSTNVDIYLHVTSRAIMEDCSDIRMAPYNLTYETIDFDFEASGLNKMINHWKMVDDFNWLNIEKKSPHWSELEESKRVPDWTDALL